MHGMEVEEEEEEGFKRGTVMVEWGYSEEEEEAEEEEDALLLLSLNEVQ